MLILASSSPTRAAILRDEGIDFKQISFNYDESVVGRDLPARIYVQRVTASKKAQFIKNYQDVSNVLFADSVVVCDKRILGKAKDENEALKMLSEQSGKIVKIVTAMIFLGGKFELSNVSFTEYEFANFNEDDLRTYLKSGDWRGKAGAMSIEGFNKKYVLSKKGRTDTAMGLNVEILKAFL